MEAFEAILTRHSVRRLKAEAPERELIEKVIEAGRSAPSGSGSRTTHMIVITDRTELDRLAQTVQNAFAAMELQEDMYISLKHSITAAKAGKYAFHYNAPVLIVTANRKSYGNAVADSACVLENMMIAANALDLGACWINQLHWLDEDADVRKELMRLGLGEEETVTGGLILGYPEEAQPDRTYRDKPGNPVTWIGQ